MFFCELASSQVTDFDVSEKAVFLVVFFGDVEEFSHFWIDDFAAEFFFLAVVADDESLSPAREDVVFLASLAFLFELDPHAS